MHSENEEPLAAARGSIQGLRSGRLSTRSLSGNKRQVNRTRPFPVLTSSGRFVGEVRGDVFYKVAKGSIHMLRRPPGWALDTSTIDDAEAAGASKIQILDLETGRTYRTAISTIRSRGFQLDRGYSIQRCLPLQFWFPGAEQLAEQPQLL